MATVKVAVSLPSDQFQLVEKRRRMLKVSRSSAVREALNQWLRFSRGDEAIRRYVEGYQRTPESTAGWSAAEQEQTSAVAQELGHEAW